VDRERFRAIIRSRAMNLIDTAGISRSPSELNIALRRLNEAENAGLMESFDVVRLYEKNDSR
jgi:hypothetical protein